MTIASAVRIGDLVTQTRKALTLLSATQPGTFDAIDFCDYRLMELPPAERDVPQSGPRTRAPQPAPTGT